MFTTSIFELLMLSINKTQQYIETEAVEIINTLEKRFRSMNWLKVYQSIVKSLNLQNFKCD